MTYTRIEKSHTAWMIFLFLLISSDFLSGNVVITIILWLILFFVVMSLGIKYQLVFVGHQLEFSLFFLSFRIFTKSVTPEQVKSIVFKRSDWTKKKAVIKMERGRNIVVVDYQPAEIFIDLENFGIQHDISLKKTKDYKLLQKYY
ncbi:hypothetical protein ACOJQI_13205 [Bacillus salacetis]|uniref:hypothetical protein n=1 Tax=Bacillus salacetis TaxID=2315464 RepID=UPI003BA02B8B